MLNFDIKSSSRKCSLSGQEFAPGEVFYSALFETEDGGTERRDFCADQWNEPPEDCIGWWRARVPERDSGRVYWAPREVLLRYFEHHLSAGGAPDIAYVVGLVLAQKKILQVLDDGQDTEVMTLGNRHDKTEYSVPICHIEGPRLEAIQTVLAEQLFMDEPVDSLTPEDDD